MKLVYKNEAPLFYILLVLSLIGWGAIAYASKGMILALIPFLFLTYVFAHSGFITHFQGRGALVSADQFPDLHEKVKAAVATLQMKKAPSTYLVNGNGVFNAFATKFLRRYYIILNSSVVDALEDNPDGINFYIGHELGHIHRRHLLWHSVLLPGMMLPLLGSAYLRACEYTCDLHGKAVCANPSSAAQALAVLAVGSRRWKRIDMASYIAQARQTSGFWMSFHELIASYPWLTKRLAQVSADLPGDQPPRHALAYLMAACIPRLSLSSLILFYCVYIFLAMPQMMKAASLLTSPANPAATVDTVAPDIEDMQDQAHQRSRSH